MKVALLCALACLVMLGSAISESGTCTDKSIPNGPEGKCQDHNKACPRKQIRIHANNCDRGLACCGYVHCAEGDMHGFLCTTESDCKSSGGSFGYGGTCPSYNQDAYGCCVKLRGDSGTGDVVADSSGLNFGLGNTFATSDDLGLGVNHGFAATDGNDLGLASNEVVPSGEFVSLGQGDEVVASNELRLGQDDEVIPNNDLFGPRYGNWW